MRPAPGGEGCPPALPPPLIAGGRAFVLDGDGVSGPAASAGRVLLSPALGVHPLRAGRAAGEWQGERSPSGGHRRRRCGRLRA